MSEGKDVIVGLDPEAPLSPDEAWRSALELWALDPEAFEGPDPARERETARVQEAWMVLRERLAWMNARPPA